MRKLGFVFFILAVAFSLWSWPATAGNLLPGGLTSPTIAAAPTRIAGKPFVAPPPQQPPSGGPGQTGFLTGPNQGDPLDIALNYLHQQAASLGLAAGDLAGVRVTDRYTSRHNGVTHIYLQQRLNGLDIYGANLNINISRDGRVINVGNHFIAKASAPAGVTGPGLSPVAAVEQAAQQLGLEPTGLAPRQSFGGPAQAVTLTGGRISQEDIPVKLVYQPTGPGDLRLAWNMVIHPLDGLNWWSLRVDANTGLILSQVDWVSRESYYVFPLPMESPNDGPRAVVTNPPAADPLASPFGWHDTNGAAGPEFTVTRGNNVSAQEDMAGDDNTTPGLQPDGGPGLVFSTTLNFNLQPSASLSASIINLFYWNNILHDLHYQYGFDEAGGNFQQNNYGRGGLGNDPVQADALDGLLVGNTDNANFATPPDGQLPRMQMYVWVDPTGERVFRVNTPAAIDGEYVMTQAEFGANSGVITANVKLANDGTGVVTDGCQAFNPGFFTGLIALIDRGNCNFVVKAANAQAAGAIGVIVVNNVAGPPAGMSGSDPSITIPVVGLSLDDGNLLKGQLPSPGVNVTLTLLAKRDSSFDNGVIAHEYGHGISNRLTGGPNNSDCLSTIEAAGMGEGWSDFWALALTAQPGDTGPQARGVGAYVFFQPADGPGIRTFPYSTDLTVNPLTLADMPGTGGEVHAIGELWAAMIWEVYWGLVNQDGFNPDLYHGSGGNNLALQLVMDGLKFQPCNPSFIEARDAILQADEASGGDNECLIWEGFAKRGLGPQADTGTPDIDDQVVDFDLPANCTYLSKSATPFAARAGGILTYTLVVRNFLPDPVTGVILTDTLPVNTSYITGSASHGGSRIGNYLRWVIGGMAPNEVVTRTFRVRVNAGLNVVELFLDDAEQGGDQWVVNHTAGNVDWTLNTSQPLEGSTAWFASDPEGNTDQRLRLAQPVTLPAGQVLSFWHLYNTETNWDGGVVEISTNGGNSWADLGSHIIKNGYNQTINSGSNTPLAGRPAFSGQSNGYLQTVIDLSSYSGQSILIRFRMVSDASVSGEGWYIDNIRIGESPAPDLVNTAVVKGTGLNLETVTLTSPVVNAPLLTYSPAQLAVVLEPQQQLTRSLTITNSGGRSLTFHLAESVPWATVSPAGGTIPPFSSTRVALVFNSVAVSLPGTYTGVLNFSGNMVNGPVTPLPLRLEIGNSIIFLPIIAKH